MIVAVAASPLLVADDDSDQTIPHTTTLVIMQTASGEIIRFLRPHGHQEEMFRERQARQSQN
jgi:hypothetical protein